MEQKTKQCVYLLNTTNRVRDLYKNSNIWACSLTGKIPVLHAEVPSSILGRSTHHNNEMGAVVENRNNITPYNNQGIQIKE